MNEQAIFLAALDIADATERAAYVNQACAGDPTLCRQVEALLEAHDRSGAFLDVPALQQLAGGTPQHRQSPLETAVEVSSAGGEIDLSFLQPSTQPNSLGRLGHYEVQAILGRGGCGIVLQAFDEILHRMVAIKVMAPEMAATSPARKRFLREARAAAAIRHENVVRIHAVEEKPIPFLVMEYISGQTLQQKLDENGPLEIQDIVQIGKQIANGLASAHAIGLIHRDIKPSNILLEKDRDLIKITDFGLARATDDASITQSGVIAGTPLYMSPEQAQGAVIDHRSDLFSLGSVLYVMCSGRPPFRAATTLAVLKRVAEEEPRPIHEIIPEVPQWLTGIISKLLAKKPADRFNSAQEVSLLLARCLSEMQQRGRVETLMPKPTNAEPEPVQEKPVPVPANRPVPSRSRRWVAAAAVFMVLIAGLGMTEATGVTNLRGTVIRLFSPDGTLVVEVDDPSVSVSIDGEEMVITGTGAKEIRLKPGSYKVLANKDGKVVRQEMVTVTKNGRQVVRVSREGADPSVAQVPTDPDRRAAEWVLSIGGKIRVNGQEREFNAETALPRESFRLTSVDLRGNQNANDVGLAHFKDCKNLKQINLHSTKVGDAGLVNFKDCKNVTGLNLAGTLVTDAGLAYFKDCTHLLDLNLVNTKVTDAGLAYLKDCKNLQSLYLHNTKLTDMGLAHFKNCKELTQVDLSETPVSDAGIAHLKDCKNLTWLWLGYTKISDSGLASFKDCKNLAWLEMGNTQVTDDGIAQFKDLKNLTRISLKNTQVSDAGLAAFKDCANMISLNLAGTRISDKALDRLKTFKQLTHLDLRQSMVTAKGLEDFRVAIPGCKIDYDGGTIKPGQTSAAPDRRAAEWVLSNGGEVRVNDGGRLLRNHEELPPEAFRLTSVVLSRYQKLGDQGWANFQGCRNITSLNLYGSAISESGLAYFKDCKEIILLNLDNTPANDKGLAVFKDCLNLQQLQLMNTQVTDKGMAILKECKRLRKLALTGTKVTDEGLGELKNCKDLETLGICHTTATDAGLAHFKDCKNLNYLDLNETQITDAGLAFFKDHKKLEVVNAMRTELTDAGLAHLKDCPSLTFLQLERTRVSEVGLGYLKHCNLHALHLDATSLTDKSLEVFRNFPTLRLISLKSTKVSEAGVTKLAAALPRCKIVWDGSPIEPK